MLGITELIDMRQCLARRDHGGYHRDMWVLAH